MHSSRLSGALATATTLAVLATATPVSGAVPPPAEPQSQRTVEIQILGLNETHGQLLPLRRGGRLAGGAAVLASYLAAEEAENRRTLILDTGDFMQGPPISSYFEGASTVELFNAMGVDAVAVGNHEFDWGMPTLVERMDEADFPFLAANILREDTGGSPEGITPYTCSTCGGRRSVSSGWATPTRRT